MEKFLEDIKVNGSWEMQFMNEMYPEKSYEYKSQKICKNRKKIENGDVKDNDIIIRSFAMWLKMKMNNIDNKDDFLKQNEKLFYKNKYFECDFYPKKWNLNKNNVFVKSVVEIEEEEKQAFFDKCFQEKKKKEKKKIKIKVKKDCQEDKDKMRKERDILLKKLNKLQEENDNVENLTEEFKKDYDIVKREVNKMKNDFTKKTGIDPDEYYKFKEFYQKYYDKEEILEKQLNK